MVRVERSGVMPLSFGMVKACIRDHAGARGKGRTLDMFASGLAPHCERPRAGAGGARWDVGGGTFVVTAS